MFGNFFKKSSTPEADEEPPREPITSAEAEYVIHVSREASRRLNDREVTATKTEGGLFRFSIDGIPSTKLTINPASPTEPVIALIVGSFRGSR